MVAAEPAVAVVELQAVASIVTCVVGELVLAIGQSLSDLLVQGLVLQPGAVVVATVGTAAQELVFAVAFAETPAVIPNTAAAAATEDEEVVPNLLGWLHCVAE